MNYLMKQLLIPALILLLSCAIAGAQPPPPDGHGWDENQHPAPIGGGMVLLVMMAGAYGARKVYKMRRRMNE